MARIIKMGVCYIVGAGDFTPLPEISALDTVIAADGGYEILLDFGIKPRLIIGDFDSAKVKPMGENVITHPEMKDETDMHLAFLEGVRRGYRNFRIYGGTGGRASHSFANYSLLLNMKNSGCEGVLVDEKSETLVIKNEEIILSKRDFKYFSVFAFGGEARGVTIKNALFEVAGISLTPEFPLGVSNRFKDTDVRVKVESGVLLVILEK